MATRARHEILVGDVEMLPRRYGSTEVCPSPTRLSAWQFKEKSFDPICCPACCLHSGEGGVGGLPSRDPYLLRRFSKPNTTISWRARVAPGNATQGGPGREVPQPRPRIYCLASYIQPRSRAYRLASDIFTERSRRRCKVAGLSIAANPAGSVRARSTARSIFCGSPPVLCASSFSTSPAIW